MSRLMIVVEFEVKPEHRSTFIELMKGHAQRTRAEDGCQQFDVLLPQEDQSRVLLVEAWRDQAALDVHLKLPAMRGCARPSHPGWSAPRQCLSASSLPTRSRDMSPSPVRAGPHPWCPSGDRSFAP